MKITVINGTEIKGCTYHIKESFLDSLRDSAEITEFYLPKALPKFCCGCKICFFKDENLCPHAEYVMPIWEAMRGADLLVFATPVYALRASAQLKCLLDHLCVHWMVHRPDERMFHKRAVILTDAIGMVQGGAQKDIATSLTWLGVPHIRKLGIGLMEGVFWNELSDKKRKRITGQTRKLAQKYRNASPARGGIKTGLLFALTRAMHQSFARKEKVLSADNRHWLHMGWIKL